MKSFFKYLLATMLGIILSSILLLFIIIGGVGAMVSSQDQVAEIKPQTVLHVQLSQPIMDRSNNNPMDNFDFSTFKPIIQLGLNDILKNLEKAKNDSDIEGIYLDLTIIPSGIATIGEIRNALINFKESGKFILAYADSYTQPTYYLASIADKIYLNPEGLVTFVGLRSEIMFFKEAMAKLGIEPQIIRHGKFKSAVEPFMYTKMSEENREQVMMYMGSIWNQILDGISKERQISTKTLNKLADNLILNNAQSAVDNGLIDGLKYKDEILDELVELTGKSDDDKIEAISLERYTHVTIKKRKSFEKNKIAVIYASGSVMMGEGPEGTIGSDRISKAIRKARKDSSIKAIVFRVNSGGGSALASEIIWREVKLAQEVKPVIASLGDVAASGGYYIVAPAQKIIASPNTITGSIGVFGLLFNGKELLNKKLGIHVDVAKTNKFSDIGSFSRRLTAQEREVIQGSVEEIYKTFTKHVADGRNMTIKEVDDIGQGRVWSGTNALDIGLIDGFGGLDEAIKLAAEEANIENYRIVNLPKLKEPLEQLLEDFQGNVKASILKQELGTEYKYYKTLRNITAQDGIQARIPYEVEIY
ncbi:MAG: signal peptide peptidase SppA [Bacteroidales bacterium]|jgi:protease-4|nr:signal peptide peptidase SppA [Bacteroidales bacterium]